MYVKSRAVVFPRNYRRVLLARKPAVKKWYQWLKQLMSTHGRPSIWHQSYFELEGPGLKPRPRDRLTWQVVVVVHRTSRQIQGQWTSEGRLRCRKRVSHSTYCSLPILMITAPEQVRTNWRAERSLFVTRNWTTILRPPVPQSVTTTNKLSPAVISSIRFEG
jgi:hypothetical protein